MERIDYQPKLIPILVLHHMREYQNVFFSVTDLVEAINEKLFAGQVERRAVSFVLKNSIEIGLPIEVVTEAHNKKIYRWVETECNTQNAHTHDSALLAQSDGSHVRRRHDWRKDFRTKAPHLL